MRPLHPTGKSAGVQVHFARSAVGRVGEVALYVFIGARPRPAPPFTYQRIGRRAPYARLRRLAGLRLAMDRQRVETSFREYDAAELVGTRLDLLLWT